MNIIISNANNQPIYEQVYLQIRAAIISGEFSEGDMLPSIRQLAKDLRLSVITTKRAYDELEKDGFIYTVASKGCYVAPQNTELIKENYLKQIEGYMQKIIELLSLCGISKDEVIEMFKLTEEE